MFWSLVIDDFSFVFVLLSCLNFSAILVTHYELLLANITRFFDHLPHQFSVSRLETKFPLSEPAPREFLMSFKLVSDDKWICEWLAGRRRVLKGKLRNSRPPLEINSDKRCQVPHGKTSRFNCHLASQKSPIAPSQPHSLASYLDLSIFSSLKLVWRRTQTTEKVPGNWCVKSILCDQEMNEILRVQKG